jgi:hypothetical protein
MREHRITDAEVAAVLRGQTPDARPELASVAVAVTMLRRASFETPPQPSTVLAARLDLERAARISTSGDELNTSKSLSKPQNWSSTSRTGRRRVASSGVVGLGLAAKIAIAVAATAAVGITGAGAAGAAGMLPIPAQEVFNQVTGQHPGGEHVSESGLEHSEFGLTTAEEARARAGAKREAALENAEAKRQAGLEKAAGQAAEQAQAGLETAEEHAEAGLETAEQKSQVGQGAAEDAGSVADDKSAGHDAPIDAPRP